MWSVPEIKGIARTARHEEETPQYVSGCDPTIVSIFYPNNHVLFFSLFVYLSLPFFWFRRM